MKKREGTDPPFLMFVAFKELMCDFLLVLLLNLKIRVGKVWDNKR